MSSQKIVSSLTDDVRDLFALRSNKCHVKQRNWPKRPCPHVVFSSVVIKKLNKTISYNSKPKPSVGTLPLGFFDCFFGKNWKTVLIYSRAGTFKMSHLARQRFCILPCSSNCSPCVAGCTLAHSLAASRTDGESWPRRHGSAAAAAYSMWPRRLPGSPLSAFHYSLFNSSSQWWTAAHAGTAF